MKNIITYKIDYHTDNGGYFVASANPKNAGIVTDGKTIQELYDNISEATECYLADEKLEDLGFSAVPGIILHFSARASAMQLKNNPKNKNKIYKKDAEVAYA